MVYFKQTNNDYVRKVQNSITCVCMIIGATRVSVTFRTVYWNLIIIDSLSRKAIIH